MSQLSDNAVDALARRVLERMVGGGAADAGTAMTPSGARAVQRGGQLPPGIFRSIDECVAAARESFRSFGRLGLEKRKEIISSVRDSMREHGESLAREAHAETGLGRAESKIIKAQLAREDLELEGKQGGEGTVAPAGPLYKAKNKSAEKSIVPSSAKKKKRRKRF